MSTENPLALIPPVLGKFREQGSGKMFVSAKLHVLQSYSVVPLAKNVNFSV